MRRILSLAFTLLAFSAPALAQQADPVGFNPAAPYITAWDGSHFQVLGALDPSGAPTLDQTATAALASSYVAAHPAPAPVVVPPPAPVLTNVSHFGFMLLFTPSERVSFTIAQAQANALQPADYTSTDPAKQALVGLQSFLLIFNAMGPSDTIDLTTPDAQGAVALLEGLGVITQARGAVILTGVKP